MKQLLFLFLLLLTSCGDDFSPQSQLGKLRILAIKADTPEINAAGSVTLTPLISHLNGNGVTLSLTWIACPDPGIDVGASINCDSAATNLKLSGTGTFDTSTLSGSYYTGSASSVNISIPAAAFTYLGTLDSKIQYNGLNYIVLMTYKDQSTNATTTALKTIKLSNKTSGELNANPTMGSILFNSSTLSAYPTEAGSMEVSTLSSPETYDYQSSTSNESLTEEMYLSWYGSTGKFLYNRTSSSNSNTFTPEGNKGIFVAIYRDGRGGLDFKMSSF